MITSLANPTIKDIRRLRERKERRDRKLAYVEGLRLVVEAVQVKVGIQSIIVAPDLLTSSVGQEAVELARQQNTEVIEVSADVFRSLAYKEDPQGLAAIIHQRWDSLDSLVLRPGSLWVALVEVADPGNLGTIMRTLDSVGGEGIILLDHSTDPYDPTALRASMGALFSLKMVKENLAEFRDWKNKNQVEVVGAAGDGDEDYHTSIFTDPMVLLMGSERQGFLPEHRTICDRIVRIPMAGRSDSLNLAVATAVILYEIYNHRRDKKGRS